ncbi:MAG: carboxypeptidase regulatory-like domain-containing protein [Acidobacteria bacterium]|nr:carboxypeptidase regulatory-like domain-containing protein [Acidobacteriota bacterium]
MSKIQISALSILLAASLHGQTITGSIKGTVLDSSGAVVPKVKVTATKAGTNVSTSAVSNESGIYNLLFLPVGDYTVSAEGSGFKRAKLGPFALETNQVATVNITLELGDVSQTIEVKDFAPILQTETQATGDTISSTKLTSIPLNGRNFAALTLLIPGAVSTAPNAMNTAARFQGSGSRPQVNGNREQTNNFILDGVDINQSVDNQIGYQPNVDALEEVKVVTGNAGAEFGNVGGASVVMALKSGTNEYHGNVFEFLRNDKLDANGFFANRSNVKRNALRQNIFGGTIGGPIQKNKMFFFADYEQTERRIAGPATASVAPAAWRNGDLSQFQAVNNQIIRDPNTGTSIATRTPFPNNQIPTSRFSPVARFLFANPSLYPLANNTGVGALGVTSNYIGASRNYLSNKQGDVKVDYRLSDKDNLMWRFSKGMYETFGSAAALPVFLTGGNNGPTWSSVVNWTRTWNTRLVTDSRFSYSLVGIDDKVIDWSGQLGADGNSKAGIPGGQFIAGLSSVGLGGGLSGIGSAATIANTRDNKFQFQSNNTYQAGTHLVKFGVNLLRARQNRYYAGNNGALGSFGYNGAYSGVDIGDFLLDALASKGRGAVTGPWGHRHWRNSLFVQDSWKIARNITFNYGLSWEYVSPIYEVADRQVNINTFTGALIYPGKTEYGRALYKAYKKQFNPNLGLAWTLNPKTVVRAAYRLSNFLEGTGANLRLTLNPPFFTESNVTYDSATPGRITTGFTDVIARGDLTSPRATPTSAPFYQGRAWDLNLRPQMTNQFNFAIERQIDSATNVNVAYVGQRGTHLVIPHEGNNPLPGVGDYSTWANINDRRPLANVLPNVGNIALTESSGTSWYNALQVSGRRRMSGGLEMLFQYTFSKTNTDGLGYYGCGGVNAEGAYWQDANNRRGNYGPACFDVRHNFTTAGVYNVPFGKGMKFGSSSNKVVDAVLGGWNVNYNLAKRGGFPVTIFAATQNTNSGRSPRGNARANRYQNYPEPSIRTVDRWFGDVTAASFCTAGVNNGTCAYGVPALGQFGNAGVGTERAPGFFNLDTSVGKRLNITERQSLEFRAEMFNILNFVSWGAPGRDITAPASFGQITGQINAPRNIQFGLKYKF